MRPSIATFSLVALGAGLVFYPFVFTGAFYLDIGVAVLLAAISASAWNIVGGYAGQVSVGHAMFFGVGAYMPLFVYHQWGLPPVAGGDMTFTIDRNRADGAELDVRIERAAGREDGVELGLAFRDDEEAVVDLLYALARRKGVGLVVGQQDVRRLLHRLARGGNRCAGRAQPGDRAGFIPHR